MVPRSATTHASWVPLRVATLFETWKYRIFKDFFNNFQEFTLVLLWTNNNKSKEFNIFNKNVMIILEDLVLEELSMSDNKVSLYFKLSYYSTFQESLSRSKFDSRSFQEQWPPDWFFI